MLQIAQGRDKTLDHLNQNPQEAECACKLGAALPGILPRCTPRQAAGALSTSGLSTRVHDSHAHLSSILQSICGFLCLRSHCSADSACGWRRALQQKVWQSLKDKRNVQIVEHMAEDDLAESEDTQYEEAASL